MKNFIYLWLALFGYGILSFVLLLRDEWALKSIVGFYPDLREMLFSSREWGLTHHLNTIPTLLFAGTVVLAFLFYWRLLNGQWIKTRSAKSVFFLSLVLQLTLLFSYPVLSSDVFDYVSSSRVAFTYQEDPWIISSINFPNDPFINLGSWQRIPSVYGPTHHLLSVLPAIVGGDSLVRWLFGYKFLMIGSTLIAIQLIAKQIKGVQRVRNLALFALNPLLLIETAGNAHNDILMVTFMLASFIAFRNKRFFLSGLMIALGTMLKLYAVVILPFFLILLVKKGKIKSILKMLTSLIGSLLLGIWIMGFDSVARYAELMEWVFRLRLNSLPNLLNQLPNWAFTTPFLILALVILRRVKNEKNLIKAYVGLTLIYLLFVVPLYWAWYPIWYLPFLSLMPLSKLARAALAFSFTSQLHYTILFLSHRFDYQHIFWTIAIYIFLVIPPTAVYLFSKNGKTT